jgi:hypothetical protein
MRARDYVNLTCKFASIPGVPEPPGSAPIPAGMVRRFHCTSPKNVESIRSEGMTFSRHMRGIEGPKAIYSWPTWEQARSYGGPNYAIVEFWHPEKAYESNPYATLDAVTSKNILAIHESWHEEYRRFKEDGPESVLEVMEWNDLDKFPNYKRAVEQLVSEGFVKPRDPGAPAER